MKLIAFVMQASEIKKILATVALPTEAAEVHKLTHRAREQPQSDLWDNAQAAEWEVNEMYPDSANQDQSSGGTTSITKLYWLFAANTGKFRRDNQPILRVIGLNFLFAMPSACFAFSLKRQPFLSQQSLKPIR